MPHIPYESTHTAGLLRINYRIDGDIMPLRVDITERIHPKYITVWIHYSQYYIMGLSRVILQNLSIRVILHSGSITI